MTAREAGKVARLACTVDGECSHCANELIEGLEHVFPEHAELFRRIYNEEFEIEEGQ